MVYTPVEIVDFILRAADDVCRQEFGYGLTDEGVHILDPFTGTGTFIVRLLESGIIRPEDLARKYASELWANEIMLLAYYIACVNIETTYEAIAPTAAPAQTPTCPTPRSRARPSPTPSRSPKTATAPTPASSRSTTTASKPSSPRRSR